MTTPFQFRNACRILMQDTANGIIYGVDSVERCLYALGDSQHITVDGLSQEEMERILQEVKAEYCQQPPRYSDETAHEFVDALTRQKNFAHIERGVRLLDAVYPGWIHTLDVEQLDFSILFKDIISLLYPNQERKQVYRLLFAGKDLSPKTRYRGRAQPNFVPHFNPESETMHFTQIDELDREYSEAATAHGFIAHGDRLQKSVFTWHWLEYIRETLMAEYS